MTQTIDQDRVVADVRYVETLVSEHIELQATSHTIHVHDQQVSVEVMGGIYEARAWRAAIDGRGFPSHMDLHGVRRQLVLGKRISVNIVEYPHPQRWQVKPHSCIGGYFWAIYDSTVPYASKLGIELSEDRATLETLAAEMNYQSDREAGVR